MEALPKPALDEAHPSRKLKIGRCYVDVLGDVVLLAGFAEGQLVLRSLMTANRYFAPSGMPLKPAKESDMERVNFMPAPSPGPTENLYRKGKVLSAIIDVLLQKGGMTMTGIVREVERRASAASKDKNVRANIRARIHWLQKRGMKLHRDDAGHLHIRHDISGVGGVSGRGDEIPETAVE